jgi:hypothetical protein
MRILLTAILASPAYGEATFPNLTPPLPRHTPPSELPGWGRRFLKLDPPLPGVISSERGRLFEASSPVAAASPSTLLCRLHTE